MATDSASPGDATEAREAGARVGSRLGGKWHLDALLGMGGTAAVYAATHRNGARGAVKVLRAAYSRDAEMRRRFVREGYIANKVEHPGVVRVLDDDVAEDGCPYLVMELLDGEPLDEVAARAGGRLSPQEVLWLAWQLLDVLAAAHAKGVVHRDVKPDNVFLTRDGAVKVLDFGLACIFEEAEIGSASVTRTGRLMGTPAFMAPEQARGRWALVDGQSDLWSVGATMFSLLTGKFVHGEEETAAEMMAATFTKPAPSLATHIPSAPMPLVQIVDCALEREKGKRFLDARSMQTAIAAGHQMMYGAPLATAQKRPSLTPRTSGRPSNDAIFSFTSSAPRPSVVPLGEQPTLSLAPPLPVTSSAPPTSPRRGRRALAALVLGSAAVAGVTAFVLLGREAPRTAQSASPSLEAPRPPPEATLPPLPPPSVPAAAPDPAPSPTVVATRPDAGPAAAPRRGVAPKPTARFGPPPVTAFPTEAASAAAPAPGAGPSMFDRRH